MMIDQDKLATTAGAAAMWLAGVSAAVLLALGLHHPKTSGFGETTLGESRIGAVASLAGAVVDAPIGVLELDPVWIFARGFQPQQGQPVGIASIPNGARDIAQMRCTGWRELEAGSGHVRICD